MSCYNLTFVGYSSSVGLDRRTAPFASDKLPAHLESQHQSGRKAGQSRVKVLTDMICAQSPK